MLTEFPFFFGGGVNSHTHWSALSVTCHDMTNEIWGAKFELVCGKE